jgi:hypothetical protein
MPWKRNDPPDPLEARRRQLAEQERLLAEQRQRLHNELRGSGEEAKPAEPPVWRLEDDDSRHERPADPTPARKRHLARQRQRDMVLFFVFILVLIIVLAIVFIIAYVHNTTPATGA